MAQVKVLICIWKDHTRKIKHLIPGARTVYCAIISYELY